MIDPTLISGIFAIAGAVVGSVGSYYVGIHQSKSNTRRVASFKFREAFSEEIAILERTSNDDVETTDVLDGAFIKHQAAINEYLLFLGNAEFIGLTKTWTRYCNHTDEDGNTIFHKASFAKYYSSNDPNGRQEAIKHLNNILSFAKPLT